MVTTDRVIRVDIRVEVLGLVLQARAVGVMDLEAQVQQVLQHHLVAEVVVVALRDLRDLREEMVRLGLQDRLVVQVVVDGRFIRQVEV
jgi:hypothetical protein